MRKRLVHWLLFGNRIEPYNNVHLIFPAKYLAKLFASNAESWSFLQKQKNEPATFNARGQRRCYQLCGNLRVILAKDGFNCAF